MCLCWKLSSILTLQPTSAHFLLSEIFLPDGTDPAMPAFNDVTDARSDDQQSNDGASDESQDVCPQPGHPPVPTLMWCCGDTGRSVRAQLCRLRPRKRLHGQNITPQVPAAQESYVGVCDKERQRFTSTRNTWAGLSNVSREQ